MTRGFGSLLGAVAAIFAVLFTAVAMGHGNPGKPRRDSRLCEVCEETAPAD